MQKITKITRFLPHALTFDHYDKYKSLENLQKDLSDYEEQFKANRSLIETLKLVPDGTDYKEFLKQYGYSFKEYGKKKVVYNIKGLYITVEDI